MLGLITGEFLCQAFNYSGRTVKLPGQCIHQVGIGLQPHLNQTDLSCLLLAGNVKYAKLRILGPLGVPQSRKYCDAKATAHQVHSRGNRSNTNGLTVRIRHCPKLIIQ